MSNDIEKQARERIEKKGMENLDDFRKKYGNIYDAIFERGVKTGQERINLVSNQLKDAVGTLSETPGNQRFEQIVQGKIAQGLSRGDAIRKAVSENPDAHSEYLARVNDNAGQKLPAKTSAPFKKFEDCVAHFISENQVTTAAAIKSAVTQYPKLHAEYVARLKQGEKGALCQS